MFEWENWTEWSSPNTTVKMSFENDEMALSQNSQQKLQRWFLFHGRYFYLQHHHSAHLNLDHEYQARRETLGCIVSPHTLKPACPASMALCVQVCWCLSEGTWTQEWLLSSNERFARYLPKSWIHWGLRVEQETLPSAKVLRRSGCMHAGSQKNSRLAIFWPAAAERKSHSLTALQSKYYMKYS